MSAITDNPAGRSAGTGALGISPAQGANPSTALDELFAQRARLAHELRHLRERLTRRVCRNMLLNTLMDVHIRISAQARIERRCSECGAGLSDAGSVAPVRVFCTPCDEAIPF
ncbi:hypothetical protein OMP43_03785 [Sphingomonas sp. CBMAI 2297]|uniref:hypothetical protein n=1 Tax=Sphingomonas sp. CBMAI 2297 TaxID=2991720 RepID=UPI0024540B9D|nr:hypothetical protein [Sphingomonas sp. CBMAI 2297]MDH4743136.1 hypothetical protein [Sphingomonas sp. CBMAI 2297]